MRSRFERRADARLLGGRACPGHGEYVSYLGADARLRYLIRIGRLPRWLGVLGVLRG
ncbi:MAG TPA: hypothetical protein VGL35_05930 [Rhizomicrobium sp.]